MIVNWSIRFTLLALMTVLIVTTATPQGSNPHKSSKDMSLATPDGLKWVQIRPGNEMAVVYGDPNKAGEVVRSPFSFRGRIQSPCALASPR